MKKLITAACLFVVTTVAIGSFIAPLVSAQETKQSKREAMYKRYLELASYVKGGSITPHWMADGSSFWYAEGAPTNTVIWKVDPKANTKTPLFDTTRLRRPLAEALGHEPPYQGLPFGEFTFLDREKAVKFSVEGKEFILHLDTYVVTGAPVLSAEERSRVVAQPGEVPSPDGRWFATYRDYNLWLRSTYDGHRVPLTTDGVKDYEWDVTHWKDQPPQWSPDGLKLAVNKVDYREVHKIPLVHWLKAAEEVEWVRFPRADGPLPQAELFIVDVLSKRRVRVDTRGDPDEYIYILGWLPDGSELLFLRANRTFKKLDFVAANAVTGAGRVVLTEKQKTFVPSWRTGLFTLLQDRNRFIWMSERDGWNHLYLYDSNGNLIRRLTEGAFPVVRIVAVDEKSGWVYFLAHGDQERPYDTHLYRVNLEGKGFARLTEATGQHHIEFAPSKQFFLDVHSSVSRPPAVELRRADGTVLQTLAKANIDALKELKWSPPEEFVVKAADGKTDLYGVLYKPYDFNPDKKYPVIEHIYAGPPVAVVPRTFMIEHWLRKGGPALAQIGFIVFIVDGRGTPGRSKEFQDVMYGNVGRHEIPDHVATLKQLAEKRPYMDLSRVGIYGHSWGGHFAMRALLLAPDVYHVGVASAPDVDLYYHIPGDVEAWMGRPQENKAAYDYGSNLWLADKLEGKLLLIHGTSDISCPFSNTMRMVEALIRANKPYDLILLPEQGHRPAGASRTYMFEAVRRYFQEHLKP